MSREYRRIQEYAKEIYRMKEEGFTHREIGKKFGLNKEQIKSFLKRDRRRQEKIKAGVPSKKKGRPAKDYVVSEQDKVAELKYIISRKEARIKALEMENELLRDFLSLTGRK